MAVIEIENLTKYYGKSRGIIDLNLNVNEGDIYGFIGPNGAGKSTTIRILLGLINPTSGSAKIFNKDCTKNKTEILADIGFIPSETMFYNGMRVNEIINLSAMLHKKDCKNEAKLLCERLQLDDKKKIEELSLGNRKKVSIICAMQHNPKLYIFDEPTSGLDPLMQKEFFSLVKEKQKLGATVFLSSHTLSEIQRYCINAAIIRDGKIIVADLVESLSKSTARRINLHGITTLPKIDGLIDIKVQENSVSFLYQGEMQKLIKELSIMQFNDITISEPDIEEIFLHFYEKAGK
jgi:ABC-2 type transport system ATP-binding protein